MNKKTAQQTMIVLIVVIMALLLYIISCSCSENYEPMNMLRKGLGL